ncbi:Uncharacterized protein Fot_23476 [Forsythia ovata]|uniref:Uncharacterized protein n=1 Tax=Forsythia ovata TaxID=205694 RepID=A0ABD1V0P7_9LAMI
MKLWEMTKSSKDNCKKWIKMNSRTCVTRSKPSPVEKLTKDLYTIWHEQQSSCFSESSEEDLLLESDKPIVSVEIGHGSYSNVKLATFVSTSSAFSSEGNRRLGSSSGGVGMELVVAGGDSGRVQVEVGKEIDGPRVIKAIFSDFLE